MIKESLLQFMDLQELAKLKLLQKLFIRSLLNYLSLIFELVTILRM